MKIELEIKDDKFTFAYEIGVECHRGSRPLTLDSFLQMSQMLKSFVDYAKGQQAKELDKIRLDAMLEVERQREKE